MNDERRSPLTLKPQASSLKPKTVLITGGAGFIGSHLAEALIADGCHVAVLDDESTGSPENLATLRNRAHFRYIKGSAADAPLVRELLDGVEQVYHLAAAVGVQMISAAPIRTIETNVYPMQVLLGELLRRARAGHAAKLFVASSSEVYGKNPKDRWTEQDELVFGPTTCSRWSYGVSKAIDEFLALAYWQEHRLPVVIGRFFNVVGPRQSGRYGMVLPRFVEAAVAGKPLVVHDDGRQVRCFAHVADVVRAVVQLMDEETAVAGVFNVGSDRPISILELAECVIAAVRPGLAIRFQTYAEAYGQDFEDVRSRVPDLTKLRRAIDFRPARDLDDAIRELAAELRNSQVRFAE